MSIEKNEGLDMNMNLAIERLLSAKDLTREEMTAVMDLVMSGAATPAQIGGFLVALRMKGESVDEITAAASVMRRLAAKVETSLDNLVDTCGTGGSGSNKFNVSTASTFVAAAAGAKVAKHGNRGASSKSGSADVLETAGAAIMLSPEQVSQCISETGLGFLFALNHHSAMKHAIGPRKELGVRTMFNLLGPLTNPAGAKRQLVGVFDKKWLVPVAEVLKLLGSEHVMVVHSEDGLDEISISAETYVAELKNGDISEYTLCPEDFSMSRSSLAELVIEDSEQSLAMLRDAISKQSECAGATNIVALNAGAAIYLAGVADTLSDGVLMAQDAIGSGLAKVKLADFVDFTKQLAL